MTGLPIVIRNVTHRYGSESDESSVTALSDVSADIGAGELVAIRGPSGSGKSTLLHLIGAIDRPTTGSVLIGENDTRRMTDHQLTMLRRRSVGFVFQFFHLIPTLTAAENVAFPLRLLGESRTRTMKKIESVLDRVGITNRRNHLPSQLSGGEQQRVAIARAIIHDPGLIVADEPTGSLDSATGDEILALFREIHENDRATIVIATHSIHAASIAHRHLHVVDGQIEERPDR